MSILITVVISLAILFCLAGFWMSLPVGVPFAPSQRFIDALPTWLQGPRRIAPSAPQPKEEPRVPSFFEELNNEIARHKGVHVEHIASDGDTPYGLVGSVVTPRGVVPVVTPDVVTMTSVVNEENHEEAAPVEVVHDEP